MNNTPNLYESFLKDVHPELLDQFARFRQEKGVFRQFVEFAHPEFKRDFEIYTEKLPENGRYRIARFYVNHPSYHKLQFSLDVGVDKHSGKYILLDEKGKPMSDDLLDNIGILTYDSNWYHDAKFGIYVKRGDEYAFLQAEPNNDALLYTLQQGKYLSEFRKYGLPHYRFRKNESDRVYQMFAGMVMQWIKDETIFLDNDTKLVPDFTPNCYHTTAYRLGIKNKENRWEARNIFYVGKLPEYLKDNPKEYDRILENFMKQWNSADTKQKEKLREGLGYSIGFR